ncbi:MAG: MmcQ/YjbR family DNA-binding protein [Bacteroidota bacterium]
MDIEYYRDYCLAKKGVTEEFPFDENTLVFKVMGKMFALCDVDLFASVNLKCDPERAIELREQHDGIIPGYHMSKKHWNTIMMDGTIPDNLAKELIDHSYDLVVGGLTKKLKAELESL